MLLWSYMHIWFERNLRKAKFDAVMAVFYSALLIEPALLAALTWNIPSSIVKTKIIKSEIPAPAW